MRGPAGGLLTERSDIIFYCHFFMTLPLRNHFGEEYSSWEDAWGFVCVWLCVFLPRVPGGRRSLSDRAGSAEGPSRPVPSCQRSVPPRIKLLSGLQIRTGLQFLAVGSVVEVFPATVSF